MTFKEKYKEVLSDIRFTDNFEENTVILLAQAAEGKDKRFMTKAINKPTKILIAAVMLIAVLSFSAFAISKLLSPGEVAGHFGESRAAEAFDKQICVAESVTDKGYTVSFLGLVKGEKFESEAIKADCSYYVVSVAASDGSPLSLSDGNPLGMSVIIEGYPAYRVNTWTLNTSANGMEENGVLYYLYDCENLEIFADKNVYLAVFEGMLPDIDTITMNTDGTFSFAEDYNGFKAMFRLPLDSSKANPEEANKILRDYLNEEAKSENASLNNTSIYEAVHNSAATSADDLNPAHEMEPMPNYKDKWKVNE